MGFSDFVQTNKGVAVGASICLLVIAGLVMVIQLVAGGKKPCMTMEYWYYDLQSGELVAHDTGDRPPVTLPSGNQGALAHVYGCGGCTGETFLGYIEQYEEDIDRSTDPTVSPVDTTVGRIVSIDPAENDGEPYWVDFNGNDGAQVLNYPRQRCTEQKGRASRARECLPRDLAK